MNSELGLLVLLLVASGSFFDGCSAQGNAQRKQRPLSWAKVITDDSTGTNRSPSTHHHINKKDDSKVLQKRALDLIFHKIIEPKIHKHIEPRPSLIEELIGTFENHVKKDLKAWGNSNQKGGSRPKDLKAYPSDLRPQIATLPTKDSKITSVAEVDEGSSEDTFIITDDSGETHVITVDEIINSLAQLDEGEITNLLVGGIPHQAQERSDKVLPKYEGEAPSGNFFIPLADDIQYSRKGTDENDVILVKSKDGDTRLVTVKDLNLARRKTKTSNSKPKESKTLDSLSNINSTKRKNNKMSPKMSPSTVDDLLKSDILNNLPNSNKNRDTKQDTRNTRPFNNFPPPSQPQKPKRNVGIKNKENMDAFEKIRQSIFLEGSPSLRNDQPLVRSPSISLPTVAAPNSPPLKVINTESSIVDFLPTQNTVSIRTKSPPVIQRKGIRARLLNFFSRLMGRQVTNVDIANQRDEDQFVQIVMPRSDSNTMEQITIPLPRPIHHKEKSLRIPKSTYSRRIQKRHSLFSPRENSPSKSNQQPNLGLNTAELILKAADIPESVREKVIAQVNDKPSFNIPGLEQVNDDANQHYDRSFTVKNKSHKKDIIFPDGFKYEIPPYFETYDPLPEGYGDNYPQYYDPYLDGGKDHKGKGKKNGDDQPLLDINLLADLVFLSKSGDDNDSFFLP